MNESGPGVNEIKSSGPASPARRRGGQPGNTNALKHGLYAHLPRTPDSGGLTEEIAMLRLVVRRLMEMSNGLEDLDEMVKCLNALGRMAAHLAGLLRVQNLIGADQGSEIMRSIHAALLQVKQEMHLDE